MVSAAGEQCQSTDQLDRELGSLYGASHLVEFQLVECQLVECQLVECQLEEFDSVRPKS